MHEMFDFTKGGLRAVKEVKGFTLYTSLSWTGKLLLGRPGKAFHPDVMKLCPSLDLGSIAMRINIMDGSLISAQADMGECDFPYPGESTRLLIASAEPMLFTAPQLKAIAATLDIGTREPQGLSEVAKSQASEYIGRLRAMNIARFPAGVASSL